MKLTTLFLILALFRIEASTYSQNTKITLDLEAVSFTTVLNEIEAKSEFKFLGNQDVIDTERLVSVHVHKERIHNILTDLFRGTDITFKIIDRQIILKREKPKTPLMESPDMGLHPDKDLQFSVTGTITDENGTPLPGANILEKGTTNGTQADFDGNFSISVDDENAVLTVSYIGYATKEISINGQNNITVSLVESTAGLEEVVVVGYGTQKRRDVTGSIGRVLTDNFKDLPVANVNEALTGQIAGVRIQQSSSAPGSSSSIRIRGTGSITAGNQPLYVIDGYPLEADNLSGIHPNDIESMDILKDASATAIYGSRGANGVILITTKQGKSGKAKLGFNTYSGFQEALTKYDLLNAKQYAELAKEAINVSWIEAGGHQDDPNDIRPAAGRYRIPPVYQNPEEITVDTDWQDEIFRAAPIQNYELNISGGNDNVRYYVSGNYLNQEGILLNSGFERYSLRANLSTNISDKLKFGINVSPSYTISDIAQAQGPWFDHGAITSALVMPPNIPAYNQDGTYGDMRDIGYGFPVFSNPIAILNEIDDKVEKLKLLTNLFMEWEVVKGLKFKTSIGVNIDDSEREYWFPTQANRNFEPTFADFETSRDINWLSETTLTYKKLFSEKHDFSALAGYTVQKNRFQESWMRASNFPNDRVRTLNAGQVTNGNTFKTEWSLLSYLGRINYGYDNKYLLSATVRADGSSRFGSDNKWGVFPSAALGWHLSEENFLKEVNFISDVKIRTSYGLTGNNAIPNYGAIGLLNPYNYVFGSGTGNLQNGLAAGSISTPGLGWEKTKQLDVGLDFSILRNRISMIADYYKKNTTDLLLDVPVPTSSGFSKALQNIGEVQNEGWEFSLNTVNLDQKLTWETNVNVSFNNNEVLALGPQGNPIRNGAGFAFSHITQIGKPIGSFYGYIADGVYIDQADLDANPSLSSSKPGDVKYRDVNGDGNITPDDRTIIGNSQPDYTWGMTNSFKYKGFDLNILLQGVEGNEILNMANRLIFNSEGNQNQRLEMLDRWHTPEAPGNGVVPRAHSNVSGDNNTVSTRWLSDGSYWSIKNITLGYSLSDKLLQKIHLSNLRIYTSVQNVFYFTDYYGYNPEESWQGGSSLTPGVDYGGYPIARTLTLGLNMGF